MKHNNRKLLAALLAATMTLSLAACGGGSGTSSSASAGNTQVSGGLSEEDVSFYTLFMGNSHIGVKTYLAPYIPEAVAGFYSGEWAESRNKAYRDYETDDFEFELNEDEGYLVCTRIKNIQPSVTIPGSVDGYPVRVVDIKNGYPQVDSITLEEGIQWIQELGWGSLKKIDLPESLLVIGQLDGCSGVTEIDLPEGLLVLKGLESCNALTSINLPDNLFELSGLSGCKGLTSINIPASVVYINGALCSCPNLSDVVFESRALKS